MCVCMCVCIYVCMYIMYVCTYIDIPYMRTYICTYACKLYISYVHQFVIVHAVCSLLAMSACNGHNPRSLLTQS